ncbi:MAG: hypothetical protein V3T86_11285 [Planctomycetota bacterium]
MTREHGEVKSAITTQAANIIKGDLDGLKRDAERIDAQQKLNVRRAEERHNRFVEQEEAFRGLVAGLPGGQTIVAAVSALESSLGGTISAERTERERAIVSVDQKVSDTAVDMKEQIGKVRDVANKASETATAMEKSVAEKLATLSDSTRDKFASITATQLEKLTELKGDRAKFDLQLLKIGLKASEVDDLKGMSTTEIMALLAAAGAGGALGKTGKSRAQVDVDALKEKLAAMNK